MSNLSPEAAQLLADAARRHGVSPDAVEAVLRALVAGGGTMAQFNHPELGGMGQWSQGGMIMVGDMFNQGLKHRVDALCTDLAGALQRLGNSLAASQGQAQGQFQSQGGGTSGFGLGSGGWWPAELGVPASSGGQNDFRYAYFPAARRLAVQQGGRTKLYDTGEHHISGVSQQQGSGAQSAIFSSDRGQFRLADLKPVGAGAQVATEAPAAPSPAPVYGTTGTAELPNMVPSFAAPAGSPPPIAAPPSPAPASPAPASIAAGDPLALIERLAELRQKGVLTDEEFAAKKAELLGRL